MLDFTRLKRNKREFLALTGLTVKEFMLLLPAFQTAYTKRYEGQHTLAGTPRQRKVGGGRKSVLDRSEQKLLFILVYLKTYPIQVVLAQLFGISQQRANYWIHQLLPVLKDALTELEVMPERDGAQFARSERQKGQATAYVIDGTERRRNRPKSPENQALHYSGKKKHHTDKNIVVTDAQTRRVGYLSVTRPGTVHDKKLADYERIVYPPHSVLHKDTGFQGYEPSVQQTLQPKKSRRARS